MKLENDTRPAHQSAYAEPARWAATTLAGMTVSQKIGQLLCVYLRPGDASGWLTHLRERGIEPGGVMLLPRDRASARDDVRAIQAVSTVPLLVAANLESGTSSFITGDEAFANPMQAAATGDVEHARRLAIHCARAAHDIGINWAFAPVADVAINPRNPITNTRAFGDRTDLVSSMVEAYVSAAEGLGVMTSPKHFPGDGVDDRDQHLVASNNDLSVEDWEALIEPVWRRLITAGARSIMVGHIRQAALSRALVPGIADEDIMPATLAPELVEGVLRGRLGFTGLIVTDNTAMAGMTSVLARREALPKAIMSGCDMLLGNVSIEEDFEILCAAVHSGALSEERLDAAVTSVLEAKASLGLDGPAERPRAIPNPAEERIWRDELAQASITLVKDRQSLLPLSAERHRRVLVHAIGDVPTFYDPTSGLTNRFASALEHRGLQVTVRSVPSDDMTHQSARRIVDSFDLVIYFASLRTAANTNTIRVVWSTPQGPDAPRLSRAEIPSLLVSVASPYLLEDLPSVGTAVNGYTPSSATVDALVAALFDEAPFTGSNPVDPFAGRWDAAL